MRNQTREPLDSAAFVETGYGRQGREVLAPGAERRTNRIGQQSLPTFRPDLMRGRNRRKINRLA